jgi:hypothetical protein
MSVTDSLLETSRADTDVLITNDEHGDILSKPREVTFLLLAADKEKADLVGSFIEDNRYGQVTVEPGDGTYSIFVRINMPIQQPIICSVSGLMACLAAIFGIEYDGWESEIQRAT